MIYDTKTSVWSAIAKPSWVGGQMRLAYLNGLVYSVGGAQTKRVFRYNPADDAAGWTEVTSLTHSRSESAVTAHAGKIYAMGGYDAGIGDCTTTAEVYDPAADTWSPIAAGPYLCGSAGAFSVGGYIYTTGYPNVLKRYDPASNSWTTMASMNAVYRTHIGGGAIIDGLLYAAAGFGADASGSGHSNLQTVERYDSSTDQWSMVANYPSGHEAVASSVIVHNAHLI